MTSQEGKLIRRVAREWNKLPSEVLNQSWFDYHINTFATLLEIEENNEQEQRQTDLEPKGNGTWIGDNGCRLS